MAIRTTCVAVLLGAWLALAGATHAAVISESLDWTITVGGVTHPYTGEGFQSIDNAEGRVSVSPVHHVYVNNQESLYASVSNFRSLDGSPVRTTGSWEFELDSVAWVSLLSYWSPLNDDPGAVDLELSLDGVAWLPPLVDGYTERALGTLQPGSHLFEWTYTSSLNRQQAISVELALNNVPEPSTVAMGVLGALGLLVWRASR